MRGPKGGIRKLVLPEKTTGEELLSKGTSLFFKHGRSINGRADTMVFNIGLFSAEIVDINNFTLEKYISENCLTKCRLYLLSKAKSFLDSVENIISSDDEDFVERNSNSIGRRNSALSTIFVPEKEQLTGEPLEQTYPTEENPPEQAVPEEDVIEEEKVTEELIQERQRRLPLEPTLFDDHIVLSVRTGRGTKRRLFHSNATMQQAYDWIGLMDDHRFFKLNHNRATILPEDIAADYAQVVLTMVPTSENPFPGANLHDESLNNLSFK